MKKLAIDPRRLEDIISSESLLYDSFNLIALQFDPCDVYKLFKLVHRAGDNLDPCLIDIKKLVVNSYSLQTSPPHICIILENLGISSFSLSSLTTDDFISKKGYTLAKSYASLFLNSSHTNVAGLLNILTPQNPLSSNSIEDILARVFILPFKVEHGLFGTISSSIISYNTKTDDGIFYEKHWSENELSSLNKHQNKEPDSKINFSLFKIS